MCKNPKMRKNVMKMAVWDFGCRDFETMGVDGAMPPGTPVLVKNVKNANYIQFGSAFKALQLCFCNSYSEMPWKGENMNFLFRPLNMPHLLLP
jgi:hypothetical protein